MAEKIVYEAELDASKLKKGFDEMGKASKKFDDNVDEAGRSIKRLGPVADGVKSKFSSLGSTIKQGFGLGLGIKLFDTFSQKLMENEKIAKLFEAAMNVVTGVINGVVEVIEPAINWMMKLFKDPKVWWEDLVNSLQKGGQWIKTNLIDLVLNKFLEWSNNAKISILELRKAWNDFTGDTEEAEKIQKTIDDLNKQNIELAKANAEKVNNIKEVVKDVVVFVENAANTIKKNVKKVIDNQDFLLTYEKRLGELQRKLQEISTQAEIDAEKQRQIRDDEFKSIDERIKANEQLASVLKKAKDDEISAQEAIIAHMQKNSAIVGKKAENEKAIAEEKIKLKEIENKYAGQESEQLTNINGLLREKISITKTMTDAELEAYTIKEQASIDELTRETDKINAQMQLEDMLYQKKMDNLNASLALEKEGTSAYAEIKAQQLVLETDHNAKVQANARALNKALSDENQARLDAVKTLFSGIASLTKENSKTAIAMQIGNAIIDTYVAANKALASAPPPFNFVMMAGVIAGGIANIKKIYEQSKKMGVDTGGDNAVSNTSTPTMSGPSIGIVGGQINSGNQLANAINGAMSKPQKSYVVGSDVSTVQGLDRKISQNATLGG
jgi:hypothetical protein